MSALDIKTVTGARGVPQGYAQDYMFVATWAMLMQLAMAARHPLS